RHTRFSRDWSSDVCSSDLYGADKIRGIKQTHQPSPWMNDYGQFSLMPVSGRGEFNQEKRASWFSHKSEVAKPYYYGVYLADHDVTAERSEEHTSELPSRENLGCRRLLAQ